MVRSRGGYFFLKAKGSGTETEEEFNLGKNIDGLYPCFDCQEYRDYFATLQK